MIGLLILLQAAATQPPLSLTCMGGGTANKPATSQAWSGGRTITVTGQRQQGFDDQVDIRLFTGDDRIRLPRTMLPAIRGGADGWFKLKNVRADERTIRASAAINVINSPKVYIDRVTGSISISGKAGDFTGQCQVIDPDASPRF